MVTGEFSEPLVAPDRVIPTDLRPAIRDTPKQVRSRVGRLNLRVPQTREVADVEVFYPKSPELGRRSERALKLAIAEMHVQGVSTRRVEAITRELVDHYPAVA
jgi:transposase-like protein